MTIKVIKPLRQSLLYRPYRWHGEHYLCVAVIVLADLSGDTARAMPDMNLWRECLPEMDCDGVLDLVLPKQVPEFLVAGRAYTHHSADKTQLAVRAQVGELSKELLVFGDRYWLDEHHASQAQPFDTMDLNWARSFGGPEYAFNPHGKGHGPLDKGQSIWPLPNVEGLQQRMQRRTQAPQLTGFGPMNIQWPQRHQYLGTYSEKWKKYDFPGFFPDMNPLLFNVAQPDQHWCGREQVPLGAEFAFWNMHPEHACWRGRLPNWRARCFLRRDHSTAHLDEELALRASTAWFLPHQERVVLIFHGNTAVREHDAADIRVLMPALECGQESAKPADYYFSVMEQRLDPEQGGLLVDADQQLMAAHLLGALSLDVPDLYSTPSWRKMLASRAHALQQLEEQLGAANFNANDYPFELVGPPTHQEWEEQESGWMQGDVQHQQGVVLQEMDAVHTEFGQFEGGEEFSALPSEVFAQAEHASAMLDEQGPPKPVRTQFDLFMPITGVFEQDKPGLLAAMAKGQLPEDKQLEILAALAQADSVPEPLEGWQQALQQEFLQDDQQGQPMQRMDALQAQMYLHSAQQQRPVDRLNAAQSQARKQRLVAQLTQGKSCQYLDMSGADLSGLQVCDADLSDIWMESVVLHGAIFERCRFDRAVLARADLADAQFVDCHFEHTNLALTQLNNSSFTRCVFKQTDWEKLSMQGAYWVDCDFHELMLETQTWSDSRWCGGSMSMCSFDHVMLNDCRFEGMTMNKLTWQSCRWQHTEFHQCHLEGSGFLLGSWSDVLWEQSRWENCALNYQNTVEASRFRRSHLYQCFFREMNLRELAFIDSDVSMCDFSRCELSGAQLSRVQARGANFTSAVLTHTDLSQGQFIDAIFTAADLRHTNLKQANLFRSHLGLAHLDDSTALHDAYLKQANIYPQRKTGR